MEYCATYLKNSTLEVTVQCYTKFYKIIFCFEQNFGYCTTIYSSKNVVVLFDTTKTCVFSGEFEQYLCPSFFRTYQVQTVFPGEFFGQIFALSQVRIFIAVVILLGLLGEPSSGCKMHIPRHH